MGSSGIEIARAFNDAINARDPHRLERLMSADHRFVDAAGATVSGRTDCVAAWVSFFESFPDYQNVFESTRVTSSGAVCIDGFSTCSFEPLNGPARWYATITDGLVHEWRVADPTL